MYRPYNAAPKFYLLLSQLVSVFLINHPQVFSVFANANMYTYVPTYKLQKKYQGNQIKWNSTETSTRQIITNIIIYEKKFL